MLYCNFKKLTGTEYRFRTNKLEQIKIGTNNKQIGKKQKTNKLAQQTTNFKFGYL